jgi:hypothetical protein
MTQNTRLDTDRTPRTAQFDLLSEGVQAPSQVKQPVPAPIDGHGNPDAQLFQQDARRDSGAIDAHGIGRASIKSGGVRVFGATIDRVAPPFRDVGFIQRGLANVLGDLFANRGLLKTPGIETYRSEAAVAAAMEKPLVPIASLGETVIFRPGLGNTAPGPAQIARLAQYTDRVIIAYANPGTADEQRVRPVDEVDGVKLPDSLRGKVFAIGSPKNVMISYEQASDLFIKQLSVMQKSPLIPGAADQIKGATVVAHSQGGLDAMLTRKRLEEAGVDHPFGKLITLATPFRGSPVSNETMAGVFSEIGERALHMQSMGAINALDPDYVKHRITDADQRFVDLSLIGSTNAGEAGRDDLRIPFRVTKTAIGAVKTFARMFQGPDAQSNDGLVTVASQTFGVNKHVLTKSYDHAGIAEDPAVIDVIAQYYARRG